MKNRDMRPMSAMALPHKAHGCTTTSSFAAQTATRDQQVFGIRRDEVNDNSVENSSFSESAFASVCDTTKQRRKKVLHCNSSNFSPAFSSNGSSSSFDDHDDRDASNSNVHMRLKKRLSIAESAPINIETVTTVSSSSVDDTTSLKEIKEANLEEALAFDSNVHIQLKKRLSVAESVPINIETLTTVSSSSVDDATSLKEIKEANLEEARVETKDVFVNSCLSTNDDETSSLSTSSSSDNLPASIEAVLQRKRMSFAESITLSVESAEKIPNLLLSKANTEVVVEDVEEGKIEVNDQDALKMKSINVSRKSSSSTSGDEEDGIVRNKEVDKTMQSDEEGIMQSPMDPSVRGDLHTLIKEENLKKVMEIIALRPELKEKMNESGWRPIHVAAADGKLEILQWLTATGSDLTAETATGYTAIHMAALHGHVKCVMALHAMGSGIDGRNIDDQTPLHLASMSGHLETVKWLVANKTDLHARDISFRTALDLSKQYHHTKVSRFLTTCLQESKDDQDIATRSKETSEARPASQRSASTSSSEDEESSQEKGYHNSDKESNDAIADMKTSNTLEEKRKMYEKQRRKMVRRRSSFLDAIRDEAERSSSESDSSDNDSSSFH